MKWDFFYAHEKHKLLKEIYLYVSLSITSPIKKYKKNNLPDKIFSL